MQFNDPRRDLFDMRHNTGFHRARAKTKTNAFKFFGIVLQKGQGKVDPQPYVICLAHPKKSAQEISDHALNAQA